MVMPHAKPIADGGLTLHEAAEVTRKYGLHMLGEYAAMWVEGNLFVTNSGTSVTAGDPFATTR